MRARPECGPTRVGAPPGVTAGARAGAPPSCALDVDVHAGTTATLLAMAAAPGGVAPIEIRHELPPDQRACPACGGELVEMTGQAETSERVTTVKLHVSGGAARPTNTAAAATGPS